MVGLTAFATVKIVGSPDQNLEFDETIESTKIVIDRTSTMEDVKLLEITLTELTGEKAFLEGSISENKKTQNELDGLLLSLEKKKVLLMAEVKSIEYKKGELNDTVINLASQLDKMKALQTKQSLKGSHDNNNSKELSLELSELRLINNKLKEEIISFRINHNKQIVDLNKALDISTTEMEEIKETAMDNENLFSKERGELIKRVEILVADKKKFLDLVQKEKKSRPTSLQLEENNLRTVRKSNKEIESLKNFKSNFEQLNGLRVIFTGNMIYDESKSQIVFRADNSIGIPIFQDDFTGSIAGKCGLPIDKEIQNRCSATIIAEFVVENSELFLRGKEIVEIVRK